MFVKPAGAEYTYLLKNIPKLANGYRRKRKEKGTKQKHTMIEQKHTSA